MAPTIQRNSIAASPRKFALELLDQKVRLIVWNGPVLVDVFFQWVTSIYAYRSAYPILRGHTHVRKHQGIEEDKPFKQVSTFLMGLRQLIFESRDDLKIGQGFVIIPPN